MNEELMKAYYMAFADGSVTENATADNKALQAALENFTDWQASYNISGEAMDALFQDVLPDYVDVWTWAAFQAAYEAGFGEGEEYERNG